MIHVVVVSQRRPQKYAYSGSLSLVFPPPLNSPKHITLQGGASAPRDGHRSQAHQCRKGLHVIGTSRQNAVWSVSERIELAWDYSQFHRGGENGALDEREDCGLARSGPAHRLVQRYWGWALESWGFTKIWGAIAWIVGSSESEQYQSVSYASTAEFKAFCHSLVNLVLHD
jgi:hypothetical protein